MAKTKNIVETKIQIMDIVMISSDIWINKLAELMLEEYGKSKTLVTPAYKQFVHALRYCKMFVLHSKFC